MCVGALFCTLILPMWQSGRSHQHRGPASPPSCSWLLVALPCALETPSLPCSHVSATSHHGLCSSWALSGYAYAQDTSFPLWGVSMSFTWWNLGSEWAVLHHDSQAQCHMLVFVFHFCIKSRFLISLQCVFCVSRLTGVYTGASVHPHTLSFNYLIQILLFLQLCSSLCCFSYLNACNGILGNWIWGRFLFTHTFYSILITGVTQSPGNEYLCGVSVVFVGLGEEPAGHTLTLASVTSCLCHL